MFVNENVDEEFIYLAEENNEFFVLVKENELQSSKLYEACIQFYRPSTDYKIIEDYRPKLSNATLVSFITDFESGDSVSSFEFIQNCVEIDRDHDFFSRLDSSNIILSVYSLVFFCFIVINCITSLVQRGGFCNVFE